MFKLTENMLLLMKVISFSLKNFRKMVSTKTFNKSTIHRSIAFDKNRRKLLFQPRMVMVFFWFWFDKISLAVIHLIEYIQNLHKIDRDKKILSRFVTLIDVHVAWKSHVFKNAVHKLNGIRCSTGWNMVHIK